MNLKNKSDDVLISDLKSLVSEERRLLMEVIWHFREVDDRKLHLERGYPSLFEFAVQELGYSNGSAQRRIDAMRLLRVMPEMESRMTTGELSLYNVSQVQTFFRSQDLTVDSKREVVESVLGLSSRECERKLVALSPEAMLPRDKTRPISDDKTLVQFVASDELLEKLEKLRNLLAHKNVGTMEELLNELAEIALKKLDPILLPAPVVKSTPSRYISTGTRRFVWKRDQGRCTYKDPKTGRCCGSRYALQLDHLLPYAWGGENTPENLALRCRAHNLYRAERMGLKRTA